MQDFVARGARARRLGADFRWPGGRHVAVVFNLAFEAWSDGKSPGVGPMGNPLPAGVFDTNALSWGHFGPSRGIHRLLRVLDRANVRASVMTSGVLAEREPATIRAMAASGHEIVAHAYAQEIVPAALTPEQQKEDVAKTTDLLAAVTGTRPVGWISPRGTPARDTARHLLDAGYKWHGDAFDDDRPYLQEFEGGRLVAIPLTMEVNDLPHAMRFGRSPRQFVELFDDLLERVLTGENEPILIDVTAHAHCYGHAAGAGAYEEIVRKAKARDAVWIALRSQIADYVLEQLR